MKKLLILFLLLGTLGNAGAQEARKGPHFRSINSLALSVGEFDTPVQIQTVNGLQWGAWYAGIGIAYDPYRYRSLPLFLDLRRRVGPARLPFFLYADAGTQLAMNPRNKDGARHEWSGGLYYDAGIGYTVPLKGRHAIELAAGFSQKRLREKVTMPTFCQTGNCPDDVYRLEYTMGRVMLRAGWSF